MTCDSWDTDQPIGVTSVVRAGREARIQRVAETVEAEGQNKLSLHSAKTLLLPILCLHWKSASSTLTLIPINVHL